MNGLICSVVLAANAASMAPLPDQWTSNYAAALQSARLQQRPLLVILEDPTKPEARVENLQPGDGTAMGEMLLRYELCRVDVNTEYGEKVAEIYDATEFPCTVITDSSCKLIMFRGFGQFTDEMWTSTLAFYARKDGEVSPPYLASKAERDEQVQPSSAKELFLHTSLDVARDASKKSNRPLLVFVTMPGCHFCDKMKAETYKDGEVKSILTQEFETVVVDQTEEPEWVHEQGVALFPATLIFSPRGEAASRIEGFVSPLELRSRIQNLGRRFLSRN